MSEQEPTPDAPPPAAAPTPPAPSELDGAESYVHESVSGVHDMSGSAVAEEPPPPPSPEPPRIEQPATHEASTSSSHRVNLVPPDSHPVTWWKKHQRVFHIVEWVLAGCLLAAGLYFLILLLFFREPALPPQPPPPSKTEFRQLLRELPPISAASEWQAPAKEGRWRAIVIHHSATHGGSPEAFDKYHREVRKWANGLGYHFVIGNGNGMEDGEVAVGHRWRDQLDGAHVKGKEQDNANAYSIGVVLVGDFEQALPTAKQLASLKGLLTFLRSEYHIGLASIVGHGDVAANHTVCPGQWFFVDEVLIALANP